MNEMKQIIEQNDFNTGNGTSKPNNSKGWTIFVGKSIQSQSTKSLCGNRD